MSSQDNHNQDIHNRPADAERDPTVSRLLFHLKEMRESVPVNYRLKEELKKKLLAQMAASGSLVNPAAGSSKKKSRKWWNGSWVLLLAVIGCFLLWHSEGVSIEIVEDGGKWSSGSWLDADLSPDGNQLVLLSHDRLLFYDTAGVKLNDVTLPRGIGEFTHVAWSPQGDQVAVVSRRKGGSAVWMINTYGEGSRLIAESTSAAFGRMTFTPDGRWIFIEKPGEVWKISTISSEISPAAKGSSPAVSPDGEHIAVKDGSTLKLWDAAGKQSPEAIRGDSAVWVDKDRLAVLGVDPVLSIVDIHSPEKQLRRISLPPGMTSKTAVLKVSADDSRLLLLNREGSGYKVKIADIKR